MPFSLPHFSKTPMSVIKNILYVTTILTALPIGTAAFSADGVSHPGLEQRIDAEIEAFRQVNNIIGMTVAVTKNGRLIHSKGYGYGFKNSSPQYTVHMKRNFRSRIGSVSKAVVTGPSAYKMLKNKGIDPKTKTLYGANSVFGSEYRSDIKIGNIRYNPIIAIAIAPNDKVYTWYRNEKVSIGSTDNLVRQNPRNFSLAEGTRVEDIRAMAIAGNSGRVYTWYNNGGVTIGNFRDLDAYRGFERDERGKIVKVRMPGRKSMLNVIGIGIAKSNDRVYIWYDDGTVSSGTSRNFTTHFTGRSFQPARSWNWRYRTRAMAIASDDSVYAWYSDGKVSAGNSGDLDADRPVYDYQAASAPLRNRYSRITIQHLFDHRSGFQRSGKGGDTSTMFAPQLNGAEPSYDQIHKHFLRTRPLKWAAGTRRSYSNHGFGLFTLIVKKLTGKSYRNYAVNNYLKPMGLKGTVRPQQASPDLSDSYSYEYTWDENRQSPIHKVLLFKNSTTGLAAGGWTASAEGLLAITKKLNEQYSFEEIGSFGWARGSTGKLEHSGLTGGGAAYVAMFRNPYESTSGKDLSGVHVAIAINTTYSGNLALFGGITGKMEALANKVALSVPDASIPVNFSLWPIRSN